MEVGATVRIKGLRSKPKLNGQDGTLLDCDSAGRWTVQLKDGDTASLQEKFLEFLAPPAPPEPPRERSPSPEILGPRCTDDAHFAALEAQEQSYFQPAYEPLGTFQPPPASSGVLTEESWGVQDSSVAYAVGSVDDAPAHGSGSPARASGSGRRRNLWAQPRPSDPVEAPMEPVEPQEPPHTAASSSRAVAGGAKAKANKMEAKLDNHLAALQAMMAEEEKKKERLLRQRAAAPVVPGMGELLAHLDEAEEEEEEEEVLDAGQATASSSSRGGAGAAFAAPSGAPRALAPGEPAVPDIGQLLAELDSQEKAHHDAPSLDNVLASIDQDEEAESSRDAFLMLGSGVEPEPDKPTDPLAKMVQLASSFKPVDLIPTKVGTPSEEERKPQLALVSRRAKWRNDDYRPAPNFVMAPVTDHLLGEGPLFGGGG